MRAPTYITTIGLTVATAINLTVLVAADARCAGAGRANCSRPPKVKTEPAVTPATVWIQFSTSAHGNSVQHLTTAYYLGITLREAMQKCERERRQISDGLAKVGLSPIIEPVCSVRKPWSWIERP